MRHIVLLDNKISEESYLAWRNEDKQFWKEHLGIVPEYTVIRMDFADYPTYLDEDKDARPTPQFLQSLADMVTSKYGDYGTDHIMMFVHSDHWKSGERVGKGMWGTSYSYRFGKATFNYCRWDKKNPVNTFGTAYHERMHTFDAIIKTELGINIEPILGVQNYDAEVVHGKGDGWSYIKWNENTKALAVMKPYLLRAFNQREIRHQEQIKGLMSQVVKLATELLYLLRRRQK